MSQKIGIIGAGGMLQYHAPGFKAGGAEIVAICDMNQEAAKKAAATYGAGHVFADSQKMLDELSDLDAISIITPNRTHKPLAIQALKAGKHVFCEKPPGRTVEDVARVQQTANEHPKLKLKYGFNHRYHASFKEALRLIDAKLLGDVINLRGVYGKSKIINFDSEWRTQRAQAGGGILLDQGIHMLDMMRTISGSFSEVYSVVSNDYWRHDVEDNAYALMKTADGVVASIHSSATQWRHTFRLEIGLTEGLIVLSGILSGSQSYGDEEIIVYEKKSDDVLEKRTFEFTEDNSWRDEIADFYDALAFGKPIEIGNVEEAYETMKLVYQIYCADTTWSKRFGL